MTTFTAAVTTGIYCRPEDTGRPGPRDVRLFPLAASAEVAGFRACLRCRPYRLAPSAAGLGPELVCRAVQLVLDGVLDEGTEHDLGARLGISARQLRRLFSQHLGLTPDQLARSARAHFARRLLDETDLPFAELAFAAGYGSVRQFNRACVEIFRATPTELRAQRRAADRLAADGGLALRLAHEAPLDWDAMLDYLAARAIPGVESVSAGIYRRTIRIDGDPGVLEMWPGGPDHLVLRAHLPRWGGLLHVVRRARRIFGLEADAESANSQLGADPVVGGLIRSRPGMRPPGTWDPFEAGVAVIVAGSASQGGAGQDDAASVLGRLAGRHGTAVPGLTRLGLTHMFPEPGVLAAADLSGLGLDAGRAAAVRAYACAVASSKAQPDRVEHFDEFLDVVTQADGVSEQTAQGLAFRLGRADAFPAGDPALLRGLASALGRPVTPADAARAAERWRPWRAHAAAHLYR